MVSHVLVSFCVGYWKPVNRQKPGEALTGHFKITRHDAILLMKDYKRHFSLAQAGFPERSPSSFHVLVLVVRYGVKPVF
jgi:hypothetical protein